MQGRRTASAIGVMVGCRSCCRASQLMVDRASSLMGIKLVGALRAAPMKARKDNAPAGRGGWRGRRHDQMSKIGSMDRAWIGQTDPVIAIARDSR